MAPKIVVARHILTDVEVAQKMLPAGFELAALDPNTPEFRAAMAGANYLVGYGGRSMDDAFYKAAPNLKLIQLLSAGYDTCDVEAAGRARVPICNNGGANSVAVAEHTLGLMLAMARFLSRAWQLSVIGHALAGFGADQCFSINLRNSSKRIVESCGPGEASG